MTAIKSIHKFREIFWIPAVLIQLVLLVNTRFTLWPEMIVYPYLLNKGFLLYRDIINPYPPTLASILSLFSKVLGYLPEPYAILTWAIVLIIDLSIFIVVRKLTKNHYYAFFALCFFILFSIPFGVNSLWFDLVQTPFIIFSAFFFYKYLTINSKSSDLQSSFYFAFIAFFIKQQATWLIMAYLLLLVFKNNKKTITTIKILARPLAFFSLFTLVQVAYFLKIGALNDFVFWTFYQPLFKASSLPGYVLFPTIKQLFIALLPTLVLLPMVFTKKENLAMLTIIALSLFFFAYPRFDYFHLIPYLAFISVSLGVNFDVYKKLNLRQLALPIAAIFLSFIFFSRYLIANWQQPVRFFEQDILSAATFIREVTPKDSLIYIQNGPDQIYPLSERMPLKPWADEFPWYLEINGTQQKVLKAIKRQDPKFVVYQPYESRGKYALGSYKPALIANYLDENYQNLIQINSGLWLKVKK